MSILYVVLPLALLVVGAAVGAYVWAARQGQFDDLTTPAMRVALDDEACAPKIVDVDRTFPDRPKSHSQ